MQGLSVLYRIDPLNMTDSTDIPENYKTIAIIRPTDTISRIQMKNLINSLAAEARSFWLSTG
jgi:hypothetical protein